MNKTFQLLLFTLLTNQNLSAQTWQTHAPPFPDTIGIADLHVVNENVIWAVGLRYGVDDSLYYFGAGNETYYAVIRRRHFLENRDRAHGAYSVYREYDGNGRRPSFDNRPRKLRQRQNPKNG